RKPPRDAWETHGRRGHLLRRLYAQLPFDQREKDAGKNLRTLAIVELLKAVKLHKQSPIVFDDLGAMFEFHKKIPDAIAAYTEALKLAPDAARVRLKRAWAYDLV